MKLSTYLQLAGFATALAVAVPHVQAASVDVDPNLCVAEAAQLDRNGDGFVDSSEYPKFAQIEDNVDTNHDGRISQSERTVICQESPLDKIEDDSAG